MKNLILFLAFALVASGANAQTYANKKVYKISSDNAYGLGFDQYYNLIYDIPQSGTGNPTTSSSASRIFQKGASSSVQFVTGYVHGNFFADSKYLYSMIEYSTPTNFKVDLISSSYTSLPISIVNVNPFGGSNTNFPQTVGQEVNSTMSVAAYTNLLLDLCLDRTTAPGILYYTASINAAGNTGLIKLDVVNNKQTLLTTGAGVGLAAYNGTLAYLTSGKTLTKINTTTGASQLITPIFPAAITAPKMIYISMDNNGIILAADEDNNVIYEIDPGSTTPVATIVEGGGLATAIVGGTTIATDLASTSFRINTVAVDNAGNVFFCSPIWTSGATAANAPNVGIYEFTGNSLLPITITSFTGVQAQGVNLLKWNIENASNFKQFNIQRSSQNTNGYATIGTVGYNSVQGSYSYADNAATGESFYRLQLVDLDGTTSYSKTVVLGNDADYKFAVRSVYPVPAATEVNVLLYAPTATNVSYTITDMNGKTIKTEQHSANQITNQPLNVSALAKGTYILKVTNATGFSYSTKFVKL